MRDNDSPASFPESLPGAVSSRIEEKIRSYRAYRFSSRQSRALNIFFDLAQEFDDTERICLLSVLVPRLIFRLEAELYYLTEGGRLVLRTPKSRLLPACPPARLSDPRREGDVLYLPVRGKPLPPGERPYDSLLGILAARLDAGRGEDAATPLFLEKFANRVGYCLHNRMLAEGHRRHVRFLRTLARDIGHNVITPNMRIKLLLRHLEGQMDALR